MSGFEVKLLQQKWGNVALINSKEVDGRVIYTAICEEFKAGGEMEDLLKAVSDSKSPEDFAKICTERKLVAPPNDDDPEV